jgi:hypothetical protein
MAGLLSKTHSCPVQKIFAPLRLCAFALKNDSAKRGRSCRGWGIFLAGGYNYFAPTALPATGLMPLRAADDPTLAHDESLAPFAAGKGLPALPFRVFCG